MATERDQRTEQASPQRQEKLRDEGKVARSPDVLSAATVGAVAVMLAVTGHHILMQVTGFSQRAFRLVDAHHPMHAVGALSVALRQSVLPVVGGAFVAVMGLGMAQTRGMFNLSHAAPKWERLNPFPNLKNVLPTPDSLKEIGKQMMKLLLLGTITYQLVAAALPRFVVLASVSPTVAAFEVGIVAKRLATWAASVFVALAAVDFFLAQRKFARDAMMSRQELRDEHKDQEGDPRIKQRLRARMREMAKQRGAGGLAQATVLITNPTHFSVAIRYVPEKDAAPMILAKGQDELALEMRRQARRFRVPVVENRALARALFSKGKVGRPIPVELYRAAAGVIAQVLRLGGPRGGQA